MGIKDVMAYFKSRQVADTPDTSAKIMGYQQKPNIHAGCTPDTSDTSKNTDSRESFLKSQPVQAANDPASAQPHDLAQPPAPAPASSEPPAAGASLGGKSRKPPKFLDWAHGWLELDRAYQHHHWSCPVCIAAGRGAGYGLRCGVGAALYRAYDDGASMK